MGSVALWVKECSDKMATDSEVIKVEGISRRYGPVTAVEDVSFAAKRGETLALLGPSGCGKTTTLRLIAGFEQPDRGGITIAGESMVGKRPYERNVGLLFQSYALFPHMTVFNNIAFGLKHRGWTREAIPARVAEMLKLVQLEGKEARLPQQLSGGQQQRVALARVLATKPQLVLLDEPLSALDAKMRESLRVELKQIIAAVGSTAIIVTHDQEEAMSLADRIIVMNGGRIEQDGEATTVYNHPASRFVASFIGRINWIPSTLAEMRKDGLALYHTQSGTLLLAPAADFRPGSSVDIGLRPEHLQVVPREKTAKLSSGSTQQARISARINLGPTVQYFLETPEGQLTAAAPGGSSALSSGDLVDVRHYPQAAIVFDSGG